MAILNQQSRSMVSARLCFFVVSMLAIGHAQANPPEHLLSSVSGQSVRVEAENFSLASENGPQAEINCADCSGGGNVGYYWSNSWFEVEVEVPDQFDYTIQLSTASPYPDGSKIEVELVSSSQVLPLGSLTVPSSGDSWGNYSDSSSLEISIPSGQQTLRFKNVGNGTNVDYIHFASKLASDVPTANPAANDGPDKNPLKGWHTAWWIGSDASNLPEVKFASRSSVGFQYIEWLALEPEDDVFDWQAVEGILNRDGSRGRHLVLQFVLDWHGNSTLDGNYRGPEWLRQLVGERTDILDNGQPIRATNYDHPQFIVEATEAITALFDRYKDDPRVHVLQIGLLGFYGEWHNFPKHEWSPSVDTQKAVFELYKSQTGANNFLQARYPHHDVTVPTPGMGYTNGWVLNDGHGNEYGDFINENDLWVNGPVGGEWPPNRQPYREGSLSEWTDFFATSGGLDFLKRGHYSYANPPSVADIAEFIPNWTPDDEQFMKMHRSLGYNLQLGNVKHLVADADALINIEMDISNVGIASFYEDWDVQLAILDVNDNVVKLIPVDTFDTSAWLPGETRTIAVASGVTLDANSDYRIGLRVLQRGANLTKDKAWGLDARNTYILLANDVGFTEGTWGSEHELIGGWNVLDEVQFPDVVVDIIADMDGDDDVDLNDVVTLTLLIRRNQITGLKYDFNEDGMVNTLDVRVMRTMCTRTRCSTR